MKYEISEVEWNNGRLNEYSSSWNQIATTLYEDKNFGLDLKKKLKSLDLQVINAKKLEGKDQVKFLYDFVRENFTWNREYGVYTDNIKKAVEVRKGNIAEINLILCNLLQKAEINAVPALIKSRGRGLQDPDFPGPVSYTHLTLPTICSV